LILITRIKKLVLGGVVLEGYPPLKGNSDADVILHSLTNAISGVTCVNILGKISDELCLEKGITDSKVYLKEALKYLNGQKIIHVSISIECLTPKSLPIFLQSEAVSRSFWTYRKTP